LEILIAIMASAPLGIGLLLIGIVLIVAGIPGLWLGLNGVVINNAVIHFGPTTDAEITFGWIMISIGAILLVVLAMLFFAKRDLLSAELPHFP
jgi:hypothetical protein